MEQKNIKIIIKSAGDRENVIVALAKNGYPVHQIEEANYNGQKVYSVCFEMYE